MREIDAYSELALYGSRPADTLTVYGWYGSDNITDAPLPISAWSLSWDVSRQVQTLSLTVEDSTGELAPWLFEDPLGVGGSRLQVIYNVGGAGSVNMGWYRITHSTPDERWDGYIIDNLGQINKNSPIPKDKMQVFATGGATIQIEAADLTILVKNNRLLAPESPKGASPTAIGEIKRLIGGMFPVKLGEGVVDTSVSKTTLYEVERLDAVEDLCGLMGCSYRMNGDGHFEIYKLSAQTPIWTVQGGPEGALVDFSREQTLEGLYNIFVAQGSTEGALAKPIRGVAYIDSGPLSYKGVHGRYPIFYNSPLLNTQAKCNTHAKTMRDTQLRGLTTDLAIRCIPHPGLQQGDWVTVATPVVNRQIVTLNGKVKKMDMRSVGTSIDAMDLVVECSYTDVQAALSQVTRDEN